MGRARQLGQWLWDHLDPTRTARRARRCAAARAHLREVLSQLHALQDPGLAAGADAARTWLVEHMRARLQTEAAAARAAVQQACGTLLVSYHTPVTLTTSDGTYLGTATAELLLEPDGRWGGVLEHLAAETAPLEVPPGSALDLQVFPAGPVGRIRILRQLPTPTRTLAIEGEGPAPFS